jgi:hypothetical protein
LHDAFAALGLPTGRIRSETFGAPATINPVEAQMRRSHLNAAELLGHFGASLDDVVEEVTLNTID